MKDIHPKYAEATVHCACGHSFETRSTKEKISVEVCSQCHPFYTGHKKLLDTAGRVEKFKNRYKKTEGKTVRKKTEKAVSAKPKAKKEKPEETKENI